LRPCNDSISRSSLAASLRTRATASGLPMRKDWRNTAK
jgi:hypothetical protein